MSFEQNILSNIKSNIKNYYYKYSDKKTNNNCNIMLINQTRFYIKIGYLK